MDFSKSESTSHWDTEYWCRSCDKSADYWDISAGFCPHCGKYEEYRAIDPQRAWRRIRLGGVWKYQYRYPDDTLKISDTRL